MNKGLLIALVLILALVASPFVLFHVAVLAVKIVFVVIVAGIILAILGISNNKNL